MADLNRDGSLDLVVADGGSDDVSVLLGAGDGTFGPATAYTTGQHPSSVTVSDLNRDGAPDLAVADADSGAVSILLGAGDATFVPATDVPIATGVAAGAQPRTIASGDVNMDGIPDLMIGSSGTSFSLCWLIGVGDGTFDDPNNTNFGGSAAVSSIAIGDVNADGSTDIVVGYSDTGSVTVLSRLWNGNFSQTDIEVGGAPLGLTVADLNRDGEPDLVAVGLEADHVSVLRNTTPRPTTGLHRGVYFVVGGQPTAITLGDFYRHGRLDFVTADHASPTPSSSALSMLIGTGTGFFTFGPTYGADLGPEFDRDRRFQRRWVPRPRRSERIRPRRFRSCGIVGR